MEVSYWVIVTVSSLSMLGITVWGLFMVSSFLERASLTTDRLEVLVDELKKRLDRHEEK